MGHLDIQVIWKLSFISFSFPDPPANMLLYGSTKDGKLLYEC